MQSFEGECSAVAQWSYRTVAEGGRVGSREFAGGKNGKNVGFRVFSKMRTIFFVGNYLHAVLGAILL